MRRKILMLMPLLIALITFIIGCSSMQLSNSTKLGRYEVAIKDAEIGRLSENMSVLRVTVDFTNNSSSNQTFAMTISPEAYHGEERLDLLPTEFEGLKNMNQTTAPGETTEVTFGCFVYNDEEVDEVKLEIFEFLGNESEVLTTKLFLSELVN